MCFWFNNILYFLCVFRLMFINFLINDWNKIDIKELNDNNINMIKNGNLCVFCLN